MMAFAGRIRFQADEDLNEDIVKGVRRRLPSVDFLLAHDAGMLGQEDPMVLAYAAAQNRILVSHDKRTMPRHFSNYLASGHEIPGLMLIEQTLPIGQAIEALVLVWEASGPEERRNLATNLPL
jgi:hypothetical protein